MMRVINVASVAVLSLALLTSCQPEAKPISPTPSYDTSSLRFRSNDDAESAARAVYESYLKASDKVGESGGTDIQLLAPYVTSAELQEEQQGVMALQKKKLHITGSSQVRAFKLQNVDLTSGALSAYVCVDVSKSRVRDSSRKDVTPTSRDDRQTSVAKFIWQGSGLRLNGTSPWFGESLC